MEKMSITRGLTKLKGLTGRIEKEMSDLAEFGTAVIVKNDKVVSPKGANTPEEARKMIEAKYASIHDLIKLKQKIKGAISRANATTKVTINGSEMTVSDVIAYKETVDETKRFVQLLKQSLSKEDALVTRTNEKTEEQINSIVASSYGTKTSIKPEDFDAIALPLRKAQCSQLIDAVGIRAKIDKMEAEITAFVEEVDFTLSESNTRTEIDL